MPDNDEPTPLVDDEGVPSIDAVKVVAALGNSAVNLWRNEDYEGSATLLNQVVEDYGPEALCGVLFCESFNAIETLGLDVGAVRADGPNESVRDLCTAFFRCVAHDDRAGSVKVFTEIAESEEGVSPLVQCAMALAAATPPSPPPVAP